MADVSDILMERKKTHGDFKDHAACTQDLLYVCGANKNWNKLCPEYREAIHMICHKIGRILTGSPYIQDHVDDIIGYATLMKNYADHKAATDILVHTTYSNPLDDAE